jgi:2-amino-4-hydroxy-6-hydroxymethyldihydropteridine diphosphokinase
MAQCLIGLGSNLGDRASLLDAAIANLDELGGTRVVSRSRYHETPPVGGPTGQSSFLNGAVLVETALTPVELLNEIGTIERELGRQRVERWGARAIDLDLLLYDDLVVDTTRLQLPHPRMAWRRFVLVPAGEVAPTMRHPKIGWTVVQLLNHLDTAAAYIAIAGPAGAGKTELARAASARLEGGLITDPVSLDCRPPDMPKSYGVDFEAEIEFAKRRAEALNANSPIWKEQRPAWISDFWVGQSAATIRALSKDSRCEALLQRWRHVTRDACPPKLTVLLDAPPTWCIERLVSRGMHEPDEVECSRKIEAVRKQMVDQTSQPGCGPVLAVDGQHPAEALEELVAAALAMKLRTHHES